MNYSSSNSTSLSVMVVLTASPKLMRTRVSADGRLHLVPIRLPLLRHKSEWGRPIMDNI